MSTTLAPGRSRGLPQNRQTLPGRAAELEGLSFRLIGPFEVRRNGQLLPAPVHRARALLAMFLLASGRAVTRHHAIRELWGEAPPASAAANLRNYLSGLRVWMRKHADGGRLVHQGEGWTVALSCEVDVAVFDSNLADGRAALAKGDLPRARELLRKAVESYRGTPMQGIPQGPVLASSALVLTARWMTAVEEYAAVLLDLGDFDVARCLLHGFLGRRPFRERAWGQLMLACSRSGDLAGALDAYQRARKAFIDGLGVEPGVEIASLHQAILRGDREVRLRGLTPCPV